MNTNYTNRDDPASKIKIASILIILGLVIVFLYAAIDSFLSPSEWVGFFPFWMRKIVPVGVLLPAFSVFEIFLSIWLLSGKYIFYAAIVAGITLFGIIVFNPSQFDITFRDISPLFAAAALAVLNRGKSQ